MPEKKTSLIRLFIPIYFETLLLMASGIVDTLMLFSVPDGVGAAGTANTYMSMFFILLTVISSGMMAVMTQNIGAGRPGVAYQTRQIALVVNALVGLLITGTLHFLTEPILRWFNTAPALLGPATSYMRIVAIGYFFDAITMIMCTYLRAFRHYRQPFIAVVVGNVVNVGLNALFLYAFKWGITGVAVATVIGKFVSMALALLFSRIAVKAKDFKERDDMKTIVKQILKIGFPAALESISYSIAMSVAIAFVNQMDPDGFNATAKAYTGQISNFSYCAAFALAQANSYFVGWRIGANQMEECEKETVKVGLVGIALGVGFQLVFALLGRALAGLFTSDEALIKVIWYALFIDIGLEVGRAGNLVFGQALKTSGYALLPSLISAAINLILAIGGTYLFGLTLHWNVLGCMFALTLDECCRAIALFIIWRSKRWQKAAVVQHDNVDALAS